MRDEEIINQWTLNHAVLHPSFYDFQEGIEVDAKKSKSRIELFIWRVQNELSDAENKFCDGNTLPAPGRSYGLSGETPDLKATDTRWFRGGLVKQKVNNAWSSFYVCTE